MFPKPISWLGIEKRNQMQQKHTLTISKEMYNTKETRTWADAQRYGRPAEYRWCPLRKFGNSIPCTMPQTLADAHCWSAVQ